MKDYSAMSDFEINKEVAYFNIGGDWLLEPSDERKFTFYNLEVQTRNTVELPDYCNKPADAWPIIVANKISILIDETVDYWSSALVHDFCDADAFSHGTSDNNPLRAAMIVYLQMMEQKS